MMILALTLAALTIADTRPGEDEAHRLDRLRTEQLNHWAAGVSGRGTPYVRATDERRYEAARARYAAQMAAWRRRVAACEGGSYSACE